MLKVHTFPTISPMVLADYLCNQRKGEPVSNVYEEYITQKGYTVAETRQTASKVKRTFPCTIGARTFDTEEEYLEALADFLNGN